MTGFHLVSPTRAPGEHMLANMTFALPPTLDHRLSDLGHYLSTQNWEALAQLYHPAYRGRRGAARYQAANEEIARLRSELDNSAYIRRKCEVTVLDAEVAAACGRLRVAERLELSWPDGCCQVTVRQLEQEWHCLEGTWLLTRTERIPRTERTHREAPLSSTVSEVLDWARDILDTCWSRFSLRRAAGALRRSLLPHSLSIAVDVSELKSHERTAFLRACEVALAVWNQSLAPMIECHCHSGPYQPDILIRGCVLPIPGESMGCTVSGTFHRKGHSPSKIATVYIPVVERADPGALCLSPTELCHIVCHELGHCLGLGDCDHDSIMLGCMEAAGKVPPAPFMEERRTLYRRLENQHSLLSRAYQELGLLELSARHSNLAVAAQEGREQEPPRVHPSLYLPLSEVSYAPPAVQHYWRGNDCSSQGQHVEALKHYDRAMAAGLSVPEVWLRRGQSLCSFPAGLASIRRAVEADADWLFARDGLIHALERMGRMEEAEAERSQLHRLTCRARYREHLFRARIGWGLWLRSAEAFAACGWGTKSLFLWVMDRLSVVAKT